MSLVEQLQADSLDTSVPITDLLRKAKATATKLKRPDFGVWIEQELSGYLEGSDVPQYRKVHSDLIYHNTFHGWRPIVGAERTLEYTRGLSEIQSLLETGDTFFISPPPREITHYVCSKLGFVADVQMRISRSSLSAIADGVRNAVLDWALKLEEAGVRGEGLSFSKTETDRAQGVTINIGSIGNAVGLGSFGDQATVSAIQTLSVEDLAAQVKRLVDQIDRPLKGSDLPDAIQKDALAALDELRGASGATHPDVGRLRHALGALKQVMEHAAGHVVGAGVLALIAQIHPAI